MKISTFIIGIVLVSLFVIGFANFFAEIGSDYGATYDADTNETLAAYNKFSEIQNITQDMNQTLFSSSGSGTVDLLGKFLGSGFNVMKIATASFGAFGAMAETAGVAIPGFSNFITILVTIALIIVLFIVVSMLVGKDI